MAENQSQQGSECDGNCGTCPSAKKDENGQATCGLPPKVDLNVKHVVLVLSGKGGVGKTTVSVNLAFALANHGKNVGLLDLDIHGPNVPKMVGVEDEKLMVAGNKIEPVHVTGNLSVVSMEFLLPNGETPVIWRGPMKMTAIKQFLEEVNWGDLDYLVVDLPPGTGDEALSIIQLAPRIEGAVIVTTPQAVSTLDSSKAVRFVEKLDLKVLGIVENMSGLICPDCGKEIDIFGKGGGKIAAEELGVPFLGAIPIDPAMREAGDEGRPFINRHNDSSSWKAIDAVMENLVKVVEE
ncbi:ATP-binding protein [Methanofollis aquaemaris]|uniref:Iron-sulfur cluster carrier protein n=1 Tax=Methanofollis aquaemaris TaxID=126734 RepID=A0A8A3S4P7_9EURY|nr:Mrp/NBP35 family ATP-binding protein [Methanofollis aquaemaris]QSZ66893.1 ATP-binding protein [Methanofollis aquaemaris]